MQLLKRVETDAQAVANKAEAETRPRRLLSSHIPTPPTRKPLVPGPLDLYSGDRYQEADERIQKSAKQSNSVEELREILDYQS